MLLQSPNSLHYPITVKELLKAANDNVDRAAPLFTYTYKTVISQGDELGNEVNVEEDFHATFESENEGKLLRWMINADSVIAKAGVQLVEIEEPCTHDVQFGGLCVNCGKDMLAIDYNTSVLDARRAEAKLPHVNNTGLLVSNAELARVEEDAKRRLLSARKLSLVVDLDQTVIHATVDPTVSEWQRDETNPNHEAVKDVKAFQLMDENRQMVWYYIKQRPGLREFFEEISKLYQLHIYTMGTRSYALEIARIIDPERKLFGDRILSRTDIPENQKHKNLNDLFPVDTKMVVIIDDRGDVWNYSDYLVKVVPYEFFVGIGDIHSPFLPKHLKPSQIPAPAKETPIALTQEPQKNGSNSTTTSEISTPKTQAGAKSSHESDMETANVDSPLSALVSMSEGVDAAEKTAEQNEVLAAQVSERPLLQRQKLLDQQDDEEEALGLGEDENEVSVERHRHSILHDDDTELEHLATVLRDIHRRFYETYDKILAGAHGGRIAELRGVKGSKAKARDDLGLVPDVKNIITSMKKSLSILRNTVLVFSKVAPLGTNISDTPVGRIATSYGAVISKNVDNQTTHLITVPDVPPDPRRGEPSKIVRPATSKVNAAERNPETKIVPDPFIWDSSVSFKALNERAYEIRVVDPPDKSYVETLHGKDEVERIADDELENKTPTNSAELKLPPLLDIPLDMANQNETLYSPGDELNDDVWAAGDAELAELSEDDEDDSELDSGPESDRSDASGHSTSLSKRKRQVRSQTPSDTEDSENSVAPNSGSELQKRKRRALDRTSSLTNVSLVNGTSKDLAVNLAVSTESGQNGSKAAMASNESDVNDSDADEEARIAAELADGDWDEEDDANDS